MSKKAEVKKFTCPNCKKEIMFKVKQEIDIPDDAVYKKKIMENRLFAIKCKNCNFGMPVVYHVAYNDMDQKYLIRVIPKIDKTAVDNINAYNAQLKEDRALQLARKDYRLRAVRDEMDLKEKIIIFDEGLDDRIVEIMKVSCANYIREGMKIQSEIMEFRFTKLPKSGEYRFTVLFKDTQPLILNFDMKQYEDIKEQVGPLIESRTAYGFNIIDAHWATDTFMAYVEANKEENK